MDGELAAIPIILGFSGIQMMKVEDTELRSFCISGYT
jgi:hypothetical protein